MEIFLVMSLVAVAAVFSYVRGYCAGRDAGIDLGQMLQIAANDVEASLKEAHDSIREEFGEDLDETQFQQELETRTEQLLMVREQEFVRKLPEAGDQDDK